MFGDARGVTALEYALITALIAIVIVFSVGVLGHHLNTAFNGIRVGL
jgi:Flp pilus assembly pilin Flp